MLLNAIFYPPYLIDTILNDTFCFHQFSFYAAFFISQADNTFLERNLLRCQLFDFLAEFLVIIAEFINAILFKFIFILGPCKIKG